MPQQPPVTTLTTDAQLREAIVAHAAIHGDPVPVWEDFLYRHPRWAAEGAHRAILDGGRIVALTTLARYEHRIGCTTLPAGEIGLVGTLPDHRKRGHSRALMESWLATMHGERMPLSFLIGIPGFYEQWDYHYAAPDHVSARLTINHDPLQHVAVTAGTVRDADPDRDLPAIAALIDAESRGTPCSPVTDEALLRFFIERADAHGVAWRVIEDETGELIAVVRMKRWGEGIGPQSPGAVTLVAARDETAQSAVSAVLLDHLLAGKQAELPLAIAPHGPFAQWLYQRGAKRRSDRSIFAGGYAAMYRINDLVPVLQALQACWDEAELVSRFAGTAVTLRVGRDEAQVGTIAATSDGIAIRPGSGGVEVGAPPAVTVPWVTGWRSAADWLDRTPFPSLPGSAFDPGDPGALPPSVRDLLRALFPARHPYIGDTTQGA